MTTAHPAAEAPKLADDDHSSLGFALPQTAISRVIEKVVDAFGSVVNWIWALLVVIIVVNVVMRYALGTNFIWVEEVQWHLYSIGFMIGIGYALAHDNHVRVDVMAMRFQPRTRALIEILGLLLLVFPMVYLVISYAIPFVEISWNRNERSAAPGGLANRWAIKSVIIIAFVYIGLAGLARFLRVCAYLFGVPKPVAAR